MVIKIIALIIGVLILGTGLYYLSKEKHDPESRKIYGIVSAVGGVVAAAAGAAHQRGGQGGLQRLCGVQYRRGKGRRPWLAQHRLLERCTL